MDILMATFTHGIFTVEVGLLGLLMLYLLTLTHGQILLVSQLTQPDGLHGQK